MIPQMEAIRYLLLKRLEKSKLKYPILAKPSGITLEQHRQDVLTQAELLGKSYSTTCKKYFKRVGKSLEKRLELAVNFHDDGKRNKKWQLACQKDYENYLKWKEKTGDSFKEYAKKNDKEVGQFLRKSGVRHEFHSLSINEKKNLPICLQVAIAAHHGKLSFKDENRWIDEGFSSYWKAFQKEGNRVQDDNLSLSDVAKLQYEFSGPRGLLQLVDHRASAIEDREFVPNFVPFSYEFPHQEKRNVQKLLEQNWEDDLLLVRAATGAGKTDGCLLWASKQIENARADRLVIAMPTRFTSNALAINVSESLSDTGLYHSSAWFNKFQDDVKSGQIEKKEASKIHEFARLLQSPVTVCTIDHLLMALTLTREDHHLITFNLANSCLVIDEADFYDDFTQANILILLEILRSWEVPVLVMSASLPESTLMEYQKIGYSVSEIKEDNLDLLDYQRPRFKIQKIQNYSETTHIEHLLELCVSTGNAIIYANTVQRAVKLFEWFEGRDIKTCLYHSRFTEPDKKAKEEMLISMLGKEAWRNKTAGGVAILTQIGEMSINISADLMISEICPIDRLTQRAGRLCRFDSGKIGNLYVLIPEKDGSLYPAPYGEYNRKENHWIASEAFIKTQEVLGCESFSSGKLVKLLNEVYPVQNEFSSKAILNAKNLKDYFKINWLIRSKQTVKDDDTEVNFWASRNIPPHETVFVIKPEKKYFNNYLEYQSWKLENAVELPVYLLKKAQKKFFIDQDEILIKDEKETILVIRDGFYGFEKGVHFEEVDPFL